MEHFYLVWALILVLFGMYTLLVSSNDRNMVIKQTVFFYMTRHHTQR